MAITEMNQQVNEPGVASETPDVHLARLYAAGDTVPWHKSVIQNLKDAFNPPKLSPLDVTAKPLQVKDIWGQTAGNEKNAALTSVLVHGGVIALLVIIGTNPRVQQMARQSVSLIAPNLDAYQPKPQAKAAGGGGGGGDRTPVPASKGKLPKIAPKQFVPPVAVITNMNPKLVMEPTIELQNPPPNVNLSQLGDPFGKVGIPSNGPGSGGGIGSGSGGGVGSGTGSGVGPGSGGGIGGGVYRVGGGVSAPALLFKVEPEYSEEARKAKFQGTVVLYVVVDEKGQARDFRVIRPLGLGLDEKAIEAVQRWKFKAGMKDGRPVPVAATIEVNFRLL